MRTEGFRGALLLALMIASITALALPILSPSPVHAALTPHAPILINSNGGFTSPDPVNGGGSGTLGDPYIIENYIIDASTANGIDIRNTTAYFVVQNCVVENGWIAENEVNYDGIELINVVNGKIDNNICENNDYGIRLVTNSDNNVLTNNTCENNIWSGIRLEYSDNNTLTNNTVENNKYYGIMLHGADNNTLDNNTIENGGYGIFLYDSDNIKMRNNTLSNNRNNFGLEGTTLSHFVHDIDTSNLVNGKPIRYLMDNSNEVIGPSLEIGFLGLVNCDDIRVKNLVLDHNKQGILIASTQDSRVENCIFDNNSHGIYLWGSDNIILTNNTCENGGRGIKLLTSSNNILTNNTVENNEYFCIRLVYSDNNKIKNNTFSSENEDGVRLYSSDNNIIENNNISNNGNDGIKVTGTSTDLHCNYNNIYNNTGYGINNTTATTVDAAFNWWGDNSGPGGVGPGTGDSISDDVRYCPWLGFTVGTAPMTFHVDNTCTIQSAIDAASPGDTIIVHEGTYEESIMIDVENLTLTSAGDTEDTVIDATGAQYGIHILNTDDVTVEGFTVIGAYDIGIKLKNSDYTTLTNNNASSIHGTEINEDEYSAGIRLDESNNNTLINNIASNHKYRGIWLGHSDNNTLINNIASNNGVIGFDLDDSDGNTFTANTASNNKPGGHGSGLPDWVGDGISLDNSSNNTFTCNTVENNTTGIKLFLGGNNNNTITNNDIKNNDNGIKLSWDPAYPYGPNTNNTIYHNNFINNDNQAYDNGSNLWDNGYPMGGNYWSDYTGVDENHGENQDILGSDGIGDTPYYISGDNNRDRYPLMSSVSISWTGTAVFSLVDIYTVNVEKILDLYQGSKLVVKFYTYGDAFENENVIENFSPPWHVEENENARHPNNTGVTKAALVLTYDNTENVISTIATFTVARDDLFGRVMEIKGLWPIADDNERNALFQEIMDIKGVWPFAPQ